MPGRRHALTSACSMQWRWMSFATFFTSYVFFLFLNGILFHMLTKLHVRKYFFAYAVLNSCLHPFSLATFLAVEARFSNCRAWSSEDLRAVFRGNLSIWHISFYGIVEFSVGTHYIIVIVIILIIIVLYLLLAIRVRTNMTDGPWDLPSLLYSEYRVIHLGNTAAAWS
jgi:hypothetical protein